MHFSIPTVDSGFDSLGYAYANDNDSGIDKDTMGCIALWCSIIEEAFRGSLDEVRGWAKSRDFVFVAEMAGVDPSVLRGAVGRMERGEIALRAKPGKNKLRH